MNKEIFVSLINGLVETSRIQKETNKIFPSFNMFNFPIVKEVTNILQNSIEPYQHIDLFFYIRNKYIPKTNIKTPEELYDYFFKGDKNEIS